jgi:DNA-binding response OmpR family regulator
MPKLERILLVDDDDDFILLLKTAFDFAGFRGLLQVAKDVTGALRFFERSNLDCLPQLVLLDVKLRPGSGFDVLRWMRAQPHLQAIPVKILAGMQTDSDQQLAAELRADEYLIKPIEFSRLLEIAEHICSPAPEHYLVPNR